MLLSILEPIVNIMNAPSVLAPIYSITIAYPHGNDDELFYPEDVLYSVADVNVDQVPYDIAAASAHYLTAEKYYNS